MQKFPLILDYARSPHAYVNQRLQIQFGLLMMSDIPLETCWAFNGRWNNKFRYQVASCWLLLLSLNISTDMLLTLSRSWNIEFEKRNDFISLLQEKPFNQVFHSVTHYMLLLNVRMVKQFNAQLFKQRKVLCVYISVISTSVGFPRHFN